MDSLTLGYFKAMLRPNFSEVGTQARSKEKACYIHFMDFLDECEGTHCDSSLASVHGCINHKVGSTCRWDR